jgi:hypothetical protein
LPAPLPLDYSNPVSIPLCARICPLPFNWCRNAAKGGKARAEKYDKATLSKWARKGSSFAGQRFRFGPNK